MTISMAVKITTVTLYAFCGLIISDLGSLINRGTSQKSILQWGFIADYFHNAFTFPLMTSQLPFRTFDCYIRVNYYFREVIKAVRDDLKGLQISHKELEQLTNLPVDNELFIITKYLNNLKKTLIAKIKGSEGATVIFISCSTVVLSYLLFDVMIKIFASWVTIPSWILLFLISIWVGGLMQSLLYFFWKNKNKLLKKNMTNSLQNLLNDVERYNAVIKSIDINDQIEEAGNPDVGIKQRERVIQALNLTKLDLIRALKTERILRENKNFILSNSDLFASNLAALTSIQVTEQATEHGRLLNEALQIALDVQYEMQRLQEQG